MNDFEALTNLTLWERQSRVRHFWDALEDCYWPDATVTTSWTSGPALNYLRAGRNTSRVEASSDEIIINRACAPLVHQFGNRAYVELPTTATHWITVNGEKAVWTSNMRLIYRCEKRDEDWKISDMTTIFEMDTLVPMIPGTDLHINPKDLEGLRRSYLWLSYVRKMSGGTPQDNLVGIDRPEDVERIYREAEAWMNEVQK